MKTFGYFECEKIRHRFVDFAMESNLNINSAMINETIINNEWFLTISYTGEVMKLILIGFGIIFTSVNAYSYDCKGTTLGKELNLGSNSAIESTYIKNQIVSEDLKLMYFGGFKNYEGYQSLNVDINLIKDGKFISNESISIIGKGKKLITIEDLSVEVECY